MGTGRDGRRACSRGQVESPSSAEVTEQAYCPMHPARIVTKEPDQSGTTHTSRHAHHEKGAAPGDDGDERDAEHGVMAFRMREKRG